MPAPPRARLRDDRLVRRQQILDEAIRIIGQRGYHGFTVQQVAQACGLTNGGLLYHFGSKECLLVAILEERDRRESETIQQGVDFTVGTPDGHVYNRDLVLGILRAIVARSAAQPELIRLHTVLQSEALDPAHPAHGYFLRREAMVLDEFASMLVGHSTDARTTARQVLAMIEGLSQQWLRAGLAFDLVAEWDRAAATLLPCPEALLAIRDALTLDGDPA